MTESEGEDHDRATPLAPNRVEGVLSRTMFVWVDPEDFLVQHNAGRIGSFMCGPIPGLASDAKLMFVPNPDFKQAPISVFQHNMIRHYLTDYNLELSRVREASDYPSRLDAGFLFVTADEAHRFEQGNPRHVEGRTLKRVKTNGPYLYSTHDGGWVDLLRLPDMKDEETLDIAGKGYWHGDVCPEASSMGKPWKPSSYTEVLFYGRIDFENRDLTQSDA